MKLTKKAAEVKQIETDAGSFVEIELSPAEMRKIYEEQLRSYVADDVRTQLENMVTNDEISQEQMDSFLADDESVQEVISETIDSDIDERYWYGIEWEIMHRMDL